MKRIDLKKVEHSIKIGDKCPQFEPNILEDSIFYADGEPIGFFMRKMPEKACKLANLADNELRSKNVPKSVMESRLLTDGYNPKTGKGIYIRNTKQYSCILGGVPAKAHLRRPYNTMSSVHQVKSAQTFIKAMILLGKESERLIKKILPSQYKIQEDIFQNVSKEWKFANLFTSSISNYNISADFHIDRANIKNTVNVIITKRRNSKGGNLHIPDYNATIDQCDNSILVYPAWRNVHGVTPIEPTYEGGYRNSLVFYPLKAFVGLKD